MDQVLAVSALRAFARHFAAGETRAALEAASTACHAAPHLPEPHYAYGQAWLSSGQPAQAENAFSHALQRRPDWADAWVNLGIARYRQGAIEDAKTAMHVARRVAPDHAAATANLGAFMRISGETEAAEALLRETISSNPHNIGVRLNLATDLLSEERAADALSLLDAAPTPAADHGALRHWHLQRTLALLLLARWAEARQTLDRLAAIGPIPAALAPLWHWRHVLLAAGTGQTAAAGAAAARMEAALGAMGPEAVQEHRIMGHFDLAKFWSGQDERAAAFVHWRAGHALLRLQQPFDREAHLAFVEASMAAFPATRFIGAPPALNRDPTPVFIVGMPRTGTTLCEQILAAHAQVHGAGERPDLCRVFTALGGGGGAGAAQAVAAQDSSTLEQAAAAYLDRLHALAPEASRIVDKMPANYLYVGLAALLFPAARFIHCVRDPRDAGLSIFTFRFHGVHGYAHDLADLGWTIAQHARLMRHWQAVLPGRVLQVRLSDWVEDFDATLSRVLAHVGLPPDPGCAHFHETERRVRTVSRAQVRTPIDGRGIGRWHAYARELMPLIEELEWAGALQGW